jgi:hypothetical protein
MHQWSFFIKIMTIFGSGNVSLESDNSNRLIKTYTEPKVVLMAQDKYPDTPKEQTTITSEERTSRILNSIVNTSVILMSIMMGAFSQLMVNTTGAMASGMAEAFAGKEAGSKVKEDLEQKLPEAEKKMKDMISGIRQDMYSQMKQKKQELQGLFSDPKFEVGPKIIDRYDFKLPKLTQEIDDETLARYSQLVISEDSQFAEMFKGLTEWLNSLPMSKDN